MRWRWIQSVLDRIESVKTGPVTWRLGRRQAKQPVEDVSGAGHEEQPDEFEEAELEDDLEEEQWEILAALARADPAPVWIGDLEDEFDESSLRIGHWLDRLMELGLANEHRSQEYMRLEGRRADRAYTLTRKGRALAVEHDLDEEV